MLTMRSSSVATEVLSTVEEFRGWRRRLGATTDAGPKALLGFVPTMGALHEGHLSLVEQAASQCAAVVVSIFVNPLQFGPNEDFQKYPRTMESDLKLCQEAGVKAIFAPSVQDFYGAGTDSTTIVSPPKALVDRLCGSFRPGHFDGVATVVTKLFGVVEPSRAYFGEKDYQQLTVIRHMVHDLNLPLEIVGCPTIREKDGLARSSRNVYLTAEQRAQAPSLHKTLTDVRDRSLSGAMSLHDALAAAKQEISSLPGVVVQYLEACDTDTLEPLTQARKPMVILVAAKFGDVRLIDNLIVQ